MALYGTSSPLKDCSDFDPEDPRQKAEATAVFNALMEEKMQAAHIPFTALISILRTRGRKAAHIPFVKTLEISCESEQKEFFKAECDKYMTTKAFKEGTKGTYGHVICCDELKFCSGPFYTQIWFFAVCGGVALLLIGIIGVVVFLLCCRKKRGGGSSGGSTMKSPKTSTKKSTK
ncbi:hypothetical protein B9Z55_008037 [Caenorhabditis nigoni]|uniref:Uncharacterized protein n=1 Tax=Caenorhabditis nigoni TaxID=1611254 RepID=A0A2G5VCL2_9PELO|nr:hypothetical protein B9Z55_008037 [Caenorhabditis nigoni]